MGSRTRYACLAVALAAWLCLPAFAPFPPARSGRAFADEAAPMEDFLYPLDFHENGKVKTRLRAKQVAQSKEKDELRAEGVILEFFDEDETATGRLQAEHCRIDRKRGKAFSPDGAIRLERDGLVLTGRGFRLRLENRHVEILNDVRLEIASLPEEVAKPETKPKSETPAPEGRPKDE